MLLLSNNEKAKWIKDDVDRDTGVARKRVEDGETAITPRQDDTRKAEKAGLTTRKPETTFEEMLNTIGNHLSNLLTSDDGEECADKDDDKVDPRLGTLSSDDEPG